VAGATGLEPVAFGFGPLAPWDIRRLRTALAGAGRPLPERCLNGVLTQTRPSAGLASKVRRVAGHDVEDVANLVHNFEVIALTLMGTG